MIGGVSIVDRIRRCFPTASVRFDELSGHARVMFILSDFDLVLDPDREFRKMRPPPTRPPRRRLYWGRVHPARGILRFQVRHGLRASPRNWLSLHLGAP